MDIFSARISIQWGNDEPIEKTSTWVIQTAGGRFVDLRPFLPGYVDETKFPMEFCNFGSTIELEGSKKQFTQELSLAKFVDGKYVENDGGLPDIGEFEELPNGDFKEVGEMANPDRNNKIEPYIEIWRDLDPYKDGPQVEKLDPKSAPNVHFSYCFDLSSEGVKGRFVRIGNWFQGLLGHLNNPKRTDSPPLSAIRGYYDTNGDVKILLSVGENTDDFPIKNYKPSQLTVNKSQPVNQLIWKCVELN